MTITIDTNDFTLHTDVAGADRSVVLTKQQSEIAQVLIAANGRYIKADEIGDQLWIGDDVKTPNKHVHVQICNLRKRLMASRMPVWVLSRYQVGYRIVEGVTSPVPSPNAPAAL